jgi:hypothetical protein
MKTQQHQMIRSATNSDGEPIAKAIWRGWHHLKAQQIATPLHMYATPEVLSDEIRRNLTRWLVCESSDPQQMGFFAISPISSLGSDKACKRWRFPESAIQIQHFACMLSGEILLHQFQLLASHLPQASILLCFASPLRGAYWAALKAGFKILGECPLIIGTFVWLYLDRDERFDEIQTKLRRAKIIIAEPDPPAKGRRPSSLRKTRKAPGPPRE